MKYSWVLAIPMFLVSTSLVYADILSPTADGTIIDGYVFGVGPVSKDGVPDQLDPSQSVQVLNLTTEEERGIVEFNVDSFNAPITSAYLKLSTIDQLGPYPLNLGLFGYAGNGAVDNTDFNNGTLIKNFTATGQQKFAFDVTLYLEDLKAANGKFAGFNLRMYDESPSQVNIPYVAFGSLEQPVSAQLLLNENFNINAAPEPPGTVLFLIGVIIFGLYLFRKQAIQF